MRKARIINYTALYSLNAMWFEDLNELQLNIESEIYDRNRKSSKDLLEAVIKDLSDMTLAELESLKTQVQDELAEVSEE